MTSRLQPTRRFAVLLGAALVLQPLSPRQAGAQERPIAYQGQLVDDAGVPLDLSELGAAAQIELRLSLSASGAETSCGTTREVDAAGQFSVTLGAPCIAMISGATATQTVRYSVLAGPAGSPTVLVSRAPVGAVPFAQQALSAWTATAGAPGFRVEGGATVTGDMAVNGRLGTGLLDVGLRRVTRLCATASSTSICSASCPAGTAVVGGGCASNSESATREIRMSRPESSLTQWDCQFSSTGEVRAYAICANIVAP